ncbi:MAG: DUF1592 domain-containing protein [Myxococcota bacterium]|nr:DUF1592 domain-containing protein [Myxococcota bacterium]
MLGATWSRQISTSARVAALALLVGCTGAIGDGPSGPSGTPDRVGPGPDPGEPSVGVGTRPLRHLTRRELGHTLGDLLGTELLGLLDSIPGDPLDRVYDHHGEAQTVSALHVEGYLTLADAIATAARDDDAIAARLMPGCDLTQLGPRARAEASSMTGASLQGPSTSYLACYVGDLWGGELMCPDVTDPDEVKLRLGDGYVTLQHPVPADGLYRIVVTAAALGTSTLEVIVDGVEAARIDLAESRTADTRTYAPYTVELSLAAGERAIRFEKDGDAIYIQRVTVVGPLDADASAQSAARAACADAFARDFAPRAWRRPLMADEQVELRSVFDAGIADGFFFDGLRMAIESVVLAPELLYHVELGTPTETDGVYRLDDFELASRLSYLAWETMPDDALWSAAAAGELRTEEQIRAQAERLFADARARATVRVFYEQWLNLHALESLTKDTTLYPEFGSDVRDAMLEETRTFMDQMIWEQDADMTALLTAPRTWLPPALAPIYGMTAPSETTDVALPAERLGLLTHASLLAINAQPNRHSPVLRGTFILRRVLCMELAPPPDDVDFAGPERSTAATTRERFVEHQSEPRCAGCHQVIDPIGFPFESFDSIGRFRTHEDGVPVDTTGGGPALGMEPDQIDGAVELAQALGDSELPGQCLARQWLRFGLGRAESTHDAATLDALEDSLASDGIRAMLVRLATTESFLNRVVDAEEVGR